jgi:hypothetical protein
MMGRLMNNEFDKGVDGSNDQISRGTIALFAWRD